MFLLSIFTLFLLSFLLMIQTIYALTATPDFEKTDSVQKKHSIQLLKIEECYSNSLPSFFAFFPQTMLIYFMSQSIKQKEYKLYFENNIKITMPYNSFVIGKKYNIQESIQKTFQKRNFLKIPHIINILLLEKENQMGCEYTEQTTKYKILNE